MIPMDTFPEEPPIRTKAYADWMTQDFCMAISLVRTCTGKPSVAMDLSSHLTGPSWILGGAGRLDWAQHQIIETEETPREMLARARQLVGRHLDKLPVITTPTQYGIFTIQPGDADYHRAEVKKAFTRVSRAIRKNEVEGVDPRAFKGFNIF